MKKFLGTLIAALCIGLGPSAWAQDATTTIPGTETPIPNQSPPSNQTDTSSPLTPSNNANTASPLTPTPPNPVAGQPATTPTSDSSSETPSTFIQPPVETNRLDAAAPTNLSLQIDPSSSESLLNPDSNSTQPTSLVPTDPGVSLNSVQQTTSLTPPSTMGSSALVSPLTANPYPAIITEPTSTQMFLSNLSTATSQDLFRAAERRDATHSASMGPLIGTAAVNHANAIETMSTGPTTVGSPTFMRSVRSSFAPPIGFGSSSSELSPFRSHSYGSSSLRSSFGHMSMSGSHSMGGGSHH